MKRLALALAILPGLAAAQSAPTWQLTLYMSGYKQGGMTTLPLPMERDTCMSAGRGFQESDTEQPDQHIFAFCTDAETGTVLQLPVPRYRR